MKKMDIKGGKRTEERKESGEVERREGTDEGKDGRKEGGRKEERKAEGRREGERASMDTPNF